MLGTQQQDNADESRNSNVSFIVPFKRKPQISEDSDRNSLMDNDSDGEKGSTVNFVIAKPPIDVTRTANHDYNSNSSLAASLHNLQVHSGPRILRERTLRGCDVICASFPSEFTL